MKPSELLTKAKAVIADPKLHSFWDDSPASRDALSCIEQAG